LPPDLPKFGFYNEVSSRKSGDELDWNGLDRLKSQDEVKNEAFDRFLSGSQIKMKNTR